MSDRASALGPDFKPGQFGNLTGGIAAMHSGWKI
mgnify:CR=1 FL=1